MYTSQILTCIFGSIIVSLLYVFLIKIMPVIMVYVMIFVSLGILALLALIGVVIGNYGLAIGMGITFLVYLIILFCFKDRIMMGIILVKVATQFIS